MAVRTRTRLRVVGAPPAAPAPDGPVTMVLGLGMLVTAVRLQWFPFGGMHNGSTFVPTRDDIDPRFHAMYDEADIVEWFHRRIKG